MGTRHDEMTEREIASNAPPRFYDCGICGHYHPLAWNGDCRDDANRYTAAQLDELYGPDNWIEEDMPA